MTHAFIAVVTFWLMINLFVYVYLGRDQATLFCADLVDRLHRAIYGK